LDDIYYNSRVWLIYAMYIEETDSTNSLMARILRGEEQQYADCLKHPIPLIYTTYQTAGRGQTGNGWESERGKNLLFSYLLLRPGIQPAEQFELNILAAILTHRAIKDRLSDEQAERLTIKWPNDIYYGDKKLAGILVENSLSGANIQHSIAGIGININQEQWVGNAPNPISLKQITDSEHSIDDIIKTFEVYLSEWQLTSPESRRQYYMEHLYRREGYWPFVEREVSTLPTMNASAAAEGQFLARITDILPTGEIVLLDRQNNIRTYHFKQIRYVIR